MTIRWRFVPRRIYAHGTESWWTDRRGREKEDGNGEDEPSLVDNAGWFASSRRDIHTHGSRLTIIHVFMTARHAVVRTSRAALISPFDRPDNVSRKIGLHAGALRALAVHASHNAKRYDNRHRTLSVYRTHACHCAVTCKYSIWPAVHPPRAREVKIPRDTLDVCYLRDSAFSSLSVWFSPRCYHW